MDLNESPIDEITSTGVRTKDGTEYNIDLLVMATGFDIVRVEPFRSVHSDCPYLLSTPLRLLGFART